MSKPQSSSLWHPTNALAALGILLLKALSHLPIRWLQRIGKVVGSIAGLLFPYRRHVGLVNLRLCFPELTEKERSRLLFRHYQSMGIGIFELAAAWYKPDEEIKQMANVSGMENLEAVVQSGRGAILLTAHFTVLEIIGRVFLTQHPISCLYRKPNQPVIAEEMTRIRHKLMDQVIHFDEMTDFLRALRKGALIWYAPDQGKRIKYSEILPFFGEPAITNTATGRIARMGKAAILPFNGYRLPDGTYHMEILPELQGIPTDDPEADAVAINKVIEGFIRRAPDQYFWLHKRFKNRGPGYPDAYAKPPR
ncbi:MAG TPA: lysophospholipid acyltransferase family protein [Oceanipulchritudo sp.]|nr:lysophospholipid acyltransferase family protein [Oceanipulchritudo sp.]